jgi:hypothetical protein
MQHQQAFTVPEDPGRQGLLQITTPAAKDRAAAAVVVRGAFDYVNPSIATPVLV